MLTLATLGPLLVALVGATALTTSRWPARLPLHLAFFVAAGVVWALALRLVARTARPRDARAQRRQFAWIVLVALAMRVPCWLARPAHSDDVYRYAWDGHVARAGINPYRYAPSSPALARLRGGAPVAVPRYERAPPRPTSDDATPWARVSNADLPTIYPPLAQLAFLVAALLPLAPVASLKLLAALADLATLLLLARLLARRGDDWRLALAWGWSPLVAVELGVDAHVDALAIALCVGALASWHDGRRALAGVLLGLSTATKLVTAPLVAALRAPRAWALALVAFVAVALPFVGAGAALRGSTGEFARRWRANDGAYALVQAATDRVVCRALHAPRVERDGPGPACDAPLDLWPHVDVARFVSGRDHRAALYPDEISAFAARAIVAALLGLVVLGVLVARPSVEAGVEWILGALVLLTPALHPWYVAWLVPLVALRRRRAWIALAVLVPLGYAPLGAWLDGGPWRDPVWTRLLEHGACWTLLALDGVQALRTRAASGAPATGERRFARRGV